MPFAFKKGDVVAILGNGLSDRMQHDGWMETLLQNQLPDQQVRFRNMSASGDRPDSFPRSKGQVSITDYLRHVKADVVFAFFGYNESFEGVGKADEYRKKLVEFVRKTRGSKAYGTTFPRIVLFSPIAHEDTHSPNVPDGKAHNVQLEAYTKATEAAAKETGVAYVDLFHPSLELFKAAKAPLTINGAHLSDEGNRQLAEVIATALMSRKVSSTPAMEPLREAVVDKSMIWHNRYRASDGNDMIDTTDFLPTLCEAVDVTVPAELKIDGHSFLPQLRGEKGNPRDGLYVWYNPSGGLTAKFEFAHDQNYKLYADGKFYNVAKDDLEKSPLADGALDDRAKAAKAKLQALLDQHKDPRSEYFVKQGQGFGGEAGEDADANKTTKGAKKKTAAPATKIADTMAARFDLRDLNHDGKLSWDEFLSTASDKDGAKARFAMFDSDKDKLITREEFLNQK